MNEIIAGISIIISVVSAGTVASAVTIILYRLSRRIDEVERELKDAIELIIDINCDDE